MKSALGNISEGKAKQVAKRLNEDIAQGHYASGEMLPSERELADRYKVSRMTMRKSMKYLMEVGLLSKQPGRGTIIAPIESSSVQGSSVDGSALAAELSFAIVMSGGSDYHLFNIQEGVIAYGEANNLNFCVYRSAEGHASTLKILKNLPDMGVSGAIILPFATDEYHDVIQKIADSGFPLVSLRGVDGVSLNTVTADDSLSTQMAAYYLLNKYHRPPYFTMISSRYHEAEVRLEAYAQAMREAGYGGCIDDHVVYDFSKDSDPTYWNNGQSWIPWMDMARRLLDKVELPASILCYHDYTAKAIYEVAEERGLTIGKDLFLVSHGDDPSAKLMDPPLTSVSLNGKQIGWEAAKLLRRLIDNPKMDPIHIHVPVKLIDRKSS